MSSADLIALAERVEAAEGPDRELDAEIAVALRLAPPSTRASKRSVTGFFCDGRSPRDALGCPQVARFTGSLDAALKLVPDDVAMLDLELSWEPPEPSVRPAVGVRWYPQGKTGKDWHAFTVSAATPALALCAAALRARAAQ